MKVLGLIGVDKYDLIHYLAKLLQRLGQKVLVIDGSSRKALTATLPMQNTVFDFGGVDFVSGLDKAKANVHLNDYDFVIIDFGFQIGNKLIAKCDEIWMISDEQKHNIINLQNVKLSPQQPRFAVIRSETPNKLNNYFLQLLAPLGITQNTMYKITENKESRRNRMRIMYQNIVSMKTLGDDILHVISLMITPYFTEREINAAIKSVRRE